MKIEPAEDLFPEIDWVKPLKPSRALIASTAGVSLVLSHIGSHADYMAGVESLDEWFRGERFPDGVHIVDFVIRSYSHDTDVGREYDEDLVIRSVRIATAEEMESYRDGEYPWDPAEWMVFPDDTGEGE